MADLTPPPAATPDTAAIEAAWLTTADRGLFSRARMRDALIAAYAADEGLRALRADVERLRQVKHVPLEQLEALPSESEWWDAAIDAAERVSHNAAVRDQHLRFVFPRDTLRDMIVAACAVIKDGPPRGYCPWHATSWSGKVRCPECQVEAK